MRILSGRCLPEGGYGTKSGKTSNSTVSLIIAANFSSSLCLDRYSLDFDTNGRIIAKPSRTPKGNPSLCKEGT